MGLAEALDSQNLAQQMIKPYGSEHAHLHSIVNAQEHMTHSVQGGPNSRHFPVSDALLTVLKSRCCVYLGGFCSGRFLHKLTTHMS